MSDNEHSGTRELASESEPESGTPAAVESEAESNVEGEAKGKTLDRATPDPATTARLRRRRKLFQGVIVTFVLISVWIAVMVGLQFFWSGGYNFRSETERILEQIRDGKVEQVYREASPRFHQLMILDRFRDLSSDINQTVGAFRRLLATKLVESVSGPGGTTRRVKATIEFDKGKTTGSFSFHWHEQRWKLLRIGIDLPEELANEVMSRSEIRAARKEAPKEIYDLAEHILEMERDGKTQEIWQNASTTFQQSIDEKTFTDVQNERRRVLGSYVRVLDTLKSARNASRRKATVVAVAQYEEAKATVTLGFIKLDDAWKLAHYKVVMPPLRISQPPEEPPPPE